MGHTVLHTGLTTLVAVVGMAAPAPAFPAAAAGARTVAARAGATAIRLTHAGTSATVNRLGRSGASATATWPEHARAVATAIRLERSGGFAGTRDTFVVDRATAGARRPLRMAGSPEFRALRGSYQPANPCCDRYSYRVTVTYRGNHHKTVLTTQGATAPHILWDVIADVERAGARPVAAGPRTA